MEVGNDEFEKCAVEIPDRISFDADTTSSWQKVISKCAPLRRGMLEVRMRATVTSQRVVDRR